MVERSGTLARSHRIRPRPAVQGVGHFADELEAEDRVAGGIPGSGCWAAVRRRFERKSDEMQPNMGRKYFATLIDALAETWRRGS